MKVELTEFTAQPTGDIVKFKFKRKDSDYSTYFDLDFAQIRFYLEDPAIKFGFLDMLTLVVFEYNMIYIVSRDNRDWIEFPFRKIELVEILHTIIHVDNVGKTIDMMPAYNQSLEMMKPLVVNKTSQEYMCELDSTILEFAAERASRWSKGQDDPVSYVLYPSFGVIGITIHNQYGEFVISGGITGEPGNWRLNT